MRHHRTGKMISILLSLLLTLQLLPMEVYAASAMEQVSAGTVLFNNGEKDRLFVSETAYSLAPGITEYVTYTNEPDGLNQNIDYFCEVDLSKAKIMTGYASMENILENNSINWRMQTVSGQVADTQSYFTRSQKYADYTIAAALNADYYNMATGQPTGLLIIDGKKYNESNGGYYFAIDKTGTALISNDKSEAALDALSYAVGGGSLLVKDGNVNVAQGGRNVTYTAIGIKADGTVVSMVCYGQSYPISCGYTQYEVANMMKKRGCQTALLLDGSGSSTFVSRREGDSAAVTRNHPSDGQERQVSSSIFFISTVKADGVFSHASISPANEVYTPGATIRFSAVGADSSGAPAPLPSGLTWEVSGDFGTIDSANGTFTSNGAVGDVRVLLKNGANEVGSATITIANPDRIAFAEEAVSMGNGDTGNLGLRVYYRNREVHYRDGDLNWTITPTQYSRKEYVNSVYNYHYKGLNGTTRTDAHPKGTTTTMQPPTQARLDHNDKTTGGWGIGDLKGIINEWVGGGLVDNYESEGWVFVSHNFRVVTENAERSSQLRVGTVSQNMLTVAPVYLGTNLAVPSHTLTDIEKTANAITATVTVTSVKAPSVSGSVTLNACKEPQVALDFEDGTDQKIFHGMTAGGASDFTGEFNAKGEYQKYETAKNESDLKSAGYDLVCVSYNNRQTGNPQIGTARVVSREEDYPVRFGDYSLRVDYNIPGSPSGNDGICFGPTEEIDLSTLGNPSKVGIWVYIPKGTPNLWLRLRYRDGSGNTSQVDFTDNNIYKPNNVARNADNGWHYFEADISKLQTPVTIPAGMAVRVMYCPASTQSAGAAKAWASPVGWVKCQTDESGNIILVDRTDKRVTEYTSAQSAQFATATNIASAVPAGIDKVPIPEYLATFNKSGTSYPLDKAQAYEGTLYFDNLTFVYGSTTEDKDNPIIDSVLVNQTEELTTGMTFESSSIDIQATYHDSTAPNNTGVSFAALYVDNKKIDCQVLNTSELRAGMRLANGSHAIKISVVDGYGNETTQSYSITINDPNGEGAPVEVSAHEASAVLGKTITLDFTPRDNSVYSVSADVQIPAGFEKNYALNGAAGTSITPSYKSASNTLSFRVSGTVNSGPIATLTLNVPADAVPGKNFTCIINGEGSGTTFSKTVTLPISAPYSVKAGQMVKGLADTCCFTILHSATGQPASGIGLYAGETLLGTSDANGKVAVGDKLGDLTILAVIAKDSQGGVSSALTTALLEPKGNADGTPTHVWRNSADGSTALNVGWLSNPLYAANSAKLRIAESEEALASAEALDGSCALTTFVDHAAAYVCGASVTGLREGTTYYYQVGDGSNWSEVQTFTTGYKKTGVDALIFGDLQESNNSTLAGILEKVKGTKFDLTIQTGDLVDNGGNYSYWDKTLTMLEPINTTRLFAIGNHEQDGGADPNASFYNQSSSNYYCAEYGNVFVATFAYNGFTDQTVAQLVNDAKASSATWKILVMHQPTYYTNAVAGMSAASQEQLYKAAQDAGIDVVLSGHDHSYARTEPLYNGSVDSEKGVTYYICGSLGEKSYGITDNPAFHFAKLSGDYSAIYMTLSTTDDTLTIRTYDFKNGNAELIDSYEKQKTTEHTHSFQWNGGSRLVCSCGYNTGSTDYTGYAAYTVGEKQGRVYFNAGTLMKGLFSVGENTVYHAGDDGFIHESETINTAQCWEDGYLGCWCKECNKFFQSSVKRRQGHQYDENHVCTRRVFSTETFTWSVCGLHGKDIATLDASLAYLYGFYDGTEKKPAVTVMDGAYKLFPQSTYGDYMPYWDNNVNVGTATVRIVGYADGPYYGETTLNFQIVPQNLSSDDFTAVTTANSARLTWNPSRGATHYIVYQRINGNLTRLGIVDEPAYTVTGLGQGSYQFCVRPFAEVDGTNYYSTKNSGIVTVQLDSSAMAFEQGSKVERTYGDASFSNLASVGGDTTGFTYASDTPSVATVDPSSGAVSVVGAGSAVITASKGELSGQYRLVVKPKPVEIEWSVPENLVYNASPVTVTAEVVSGLLEGDSCMVTVSGGSETNAGTYTAVAQSLSNPNYALPAEASKQYTIAPATITSLTWSNTELTFTGGPLAPTATAAAGVFGGDEITFAVPKATEVGSYIVTAVSTNPNYTVAQSAPSCSFEIVMPEVTLTVPGDCKVTWHMEGTTIYLSGSAGSESSKVTVTVSAKLPDLRSASTEVSCGQVNAKVSLGGVEYPVNAEAFVFVPTNISLTDGSTAPTIPEEIGVTGDDLTELQAAANNVGNKLTNLIAAVAKSAAQIVQSALGDSLSDSGDLNLELYKNLTVIEYKPGESYSVDITPRYRLTAASGEMETKEGDVPNDAINAPVEVALTIPEGIDLSGSTVFIRHIHSDGRITYIRPHRIDGRTVYFYTSSFSTFALVRDSRTAQIAFPTESGTQTKLYGPDDIGTALPAATAPANHSFKGWKLNGTVYTGVTEAMLNALKDSGVVSAEAVFQATNNSFFGGGGGSSAPLYTITAEKTVNGAISVSSKTAAKGDIVTISVTPNKGYTLEALVVLDKSNREIDVAAKGGKYTFVMPASAVSVKATFAEDNSMLNYFTDVSTADFYYDAVLWAAKSDITNGVNSTEFGPDLGCTRAQIVTFLYRCAVAQGVDVSGGESTNILSYTDALEVPEFAFEAFQWAVGAGIIQGADGKLMPNDDCTRAQIVTMLYRYAVTTGKDVSVGEDTNILSYADFASVPEFAVEPFQWACGEGIIQGADGKLMPNDTCTRGQIVTMLYRANG